MRSAVIIKGRKKCFLEGKGMYFTNFTIGCRSKRVGVLIYSIGKVFFDWTH